MNINSHLLCFKKIYFLLIVFSWQDLKQIWVRLVHSVPCIISWQIFVLAIKKRRKKEREIDTEGWKYKYGRKPNAHPKKLIS